ncbi:MAG TPA: LytR C-terminal domain-containing protein [Chloroflexota bacterium]|nr:LytR C-terminal domain-containing protein [Chloroflexota bacterium]
MAQTPVEVINASGTPGLGTRVAASLLDHGYRIDTVTSGDPVNQSHLLAQIDDGNRDLARRLAKDLSLPDLPTSADGATNGQFTLVLGTDAVDLVIPSAEGTAPSSSFGILKFGVWDPSVVAPPTPTPVYSTPASGSGPRSTPTEEIRTPTPVSVAATPVRSPKNPNLIVVPRLVGIPEAAAQQLINESGLMTTYVNYQTINDVADKAFFRSIAPGAVLSQNPAPGIEVPRGTKVQLAVRKN